MTKWFKFIGKVSVFGVRAIGRSFRPPFEVQSLWNQIEEVGSRSLSLVVAPGFALGVVMTLHTRSTLVMFGAAAMIPRVQSLGSWWRSVHSSLVCLLQDVSAPGSERYLQI